MSLRSLVYVSSANRLLSPEQLSELLQISRRNNVRDGITGMLLYKEGNFMQAIEGEEGAVAKLHGRIMQDARHHGLFTLLDRQLPQREFTAWAMGFRNFGDPGTADLPGYSEFMSAKFTEGEFGGNPAKALKLLRTFR